MNCKPGDLAIIVRSMRTPELLGRMVTVLHACPIGVGFNLPDGVYHVPVGHVDGLQRWVCAFANPVSAPYGPPGSVGTRETVFAPIPDVCLKPVRDAGDDAVDETLLRLPAPKREEVTS